MMKRDWNIYEEKEFLKTVGKKPPLVTKILQRLRMSSCVKLRPLHLLELDNAFGRKAPEALGLYSLIEFFELQVATIATHLQ